MQRLGFNLGRESLELMAQMAQASLKNKIWERDKYLIKRKLI
jgi:hypothetical protein